MSVSISIVLDTRRIKKKSGKFPVKLQVIQNRKPVRYQTVYDLTEKEYQNLSAPRVSDAMLKIREDLKKVEHNAEAAANGIIPFAQDEFETVFIFNNPLFRQRGYLKKKVEQHYSSNDEFDYTPYLKKFPTLSESPSEPGMLRFTYQCIIKKCLQTGSIGTAVSYQCGYRSLSKYRKNLCFSDITVSFLNQYESWFMQKGNSKATLSIYLRGLRAVFNEAAEDGIVSKGKNYPFGRRKYLIPVSRNTKRSLTPEDIRNIYYYVPICENEQRARDYWLFCYFANGINPKDVALLKYKNIQGDFIVFERAKTIRTARTDPRPISIYINEAINDIIQKMGNNDRDPDNYIFPVLKQAMTPMEQYLQIGLFIHFINDRMDKIRRELGIDRKVTTIVSRHSFSTILKNAGASTEFIQESLGHTDIRTTENYLGSFEQKIKKTFSEKLMPLGKEVQME